MTADREEVTVASRGELRVWLAAHHATSPGVWLVTWKRGRGPHLPYGDLVEEALCFGWVDGRARAIDADRSARLLTPRRPRGGWSRLNKERVARLTAAGLMHPAGLAAVDAAKARGTWRALDEVEDLVEPPDLTAALDRDPAARTAWDAFPRSAKRAILAWIASARTAPTRDRRVEETVTEARAGRRANSWTRRP